MWVFIDSACKIDPRVGMPKGSHSEEDCCFSFVRLLLALLFVLVKYAGDDPDRVEDPQYVVLCVFFTICVQN